MKTNSAPSRYRYCISRRSTLATSTLTPALKVRSTTLPDMMFKVDDLARHDVLQLGAHEGAALARLDMLELDNGPELPVEVQRHAVLQVVRGGHVSVSRLKNEKFSRRSREEARPVGPHDKNVLDPDAAPAGQVDTRLDGDWNPTGQFTRSGVPDRRRLVHLEPDAVPQPVLEVVAVP